MVKQKGFHVNWAKFSDLSYVDSDDLKRALSLMKLGSDYLTELLKLREVK